MTTKKNDKAVSVFCFAQGSIAVCVNGKQVAEAQDPWILAVAENLKKAGLDPLDAEINMPDGRVATFFRCDDGSLNWNVK